MAIRRFTLAATTGNDNKTINEPNSKDQWIYTWDGLAGTDQLGFDRLTRSQFAITKDTAGAVHVDSVSSASHIITATLNNVEKLSFNNGADIVDLVAMFPSDIIAPTIALSSNASSLGVGQTATITFTLSEVSTDFTAADITVSGGTLTNFVGSGISYTATFTPTANSSANGVISVASGKFSDAAGNVNADGSDADNAVTLVVNTIQYSPVAGDDFSNTLRSTSADEAFDGAGGVDTVVVQGTRSQYVLTQQSTGVFKISDSTTNRDGTDTLTGIERLQFSDETIGLLDLASTATQSWKLSSTALIFSANGSEVAYDHASNSIDQVFYADEVSRSVMSLLPQARLSANGAYDAKVQAYFMASLGREASAQELQDYSNILATNRGSVWLDTAGKGGTSGSLVGALFASADFSTLTTGKSNTDIVKNMYARLTNDNIPSDDLLQFYVSQLGSGSIKLRGLANAMLNDLSLMPRADGILSQPNGWPTNLRNEMDTKDYFGYLTELELVGVDVTNLTNGVFG